MGDELEKFKVELTDAIQAACPFCGGTLIFGFHKVTGNLQAVHGPVPSADVHILGCETFRALVYTNPGEFIRLVNSHRPHWTRLAG